MTASFDRKELLASLVELEKLARERGRPAPLAAIPSDQLRIDLDAILASEKSRTATQAVKVEDAAPFTPTLSPEWPPRSGWPFLVAPASVIAIALLVFGAGYEAWSSLTSVEPRALPPIENNSAVAEARADLDQAAAEPAVAALPDPPKPLAAAEERVSPGAIQSEPGPAPEAARPERKAKKAAADKSKTHEREVERHPKPTKPKPSTVATGHTPPRAAPTADNANAEPTVISDARRVTQTIAGVLNGWVGVDPHERR